MSIFPGMGSIYDLRQQLTAANERIGVLKQSHTEASDLFADCVAGQADLRRKLTAERAISDKLEKVAAAVVERWDTPPWVFKTLRATLAEVEAMRKGEQ